MAGHVGETTIGCTIANVATHPPAATPARDGIAYLWVEVLGHPGRPLAAALGVRPQAAYQAVARGRESSGPPPISSTFSASSSGEY